VRQGEGKNSRFDEAQRYLEDGSEFIPHMSLISLATSQWDSSSVAAVSVDSTWRSFSACREFCMKRRLRVPLLIVAVMMRVTKRQCSMLSSRQPPTTCRHHVIVDLSATSTSHHHHVSNSTLLATVRRYQPWKPRGHRPYAKEKNTNAFGQRLII